jgi:exopolysaccharide production protein ExoZ
MLQSVQICRGLAALLVVVYHTSAIMGLQKYGSQNIFSGYLSSLGFIGVDFFFVLSGFIIPFAHQKDVGRPDRFRRYAYRRVTRIYPIYWLYLTIILIAYQVRGEQSISSFSDYFSFYSLLRVSGTATPIPQAWSLFHEIIFYAMFGILISNRRIGALVIGLWLLIIVIHFDYAPYSFGPAAWRDFAGVAFSLLNLNFLWGVTVLFALRPMPPRIGLLLIGIGIVALIIVAIAERTGTLTLYPQLRALDGPASASILAGLISMERYIGRYASPIFSFFGDASYSIYLTHYAVLSVLAKIAVSLNIFGLLAPIPAFAILVVIATAAGCTLYALVERPLLDILRPKKLRLNGTFGTVKVEAVVQK